MSKKLEGYKPQWDPKVFDGAHPDQEFKEIKRCEECGEVITETWGDTPICSECQLVPANFETTHQCSLCLKEHEKEECNCYEK